MQTMDRTRVDDEAARAAAGGWSEGIIEQLVEQVGGRAGVHAAFGEPFARDGTTVIPVARIRWGFGGGGGSAGASGQSESGSGGGGVAADPIGYIEITAAGAEFRRIDAGLPSPLFVLACGLTAAIVLRALAALRGG